VCGLLYENFRNFITGQCLEAVILGTMFVVSMSILRLPYAAVIGILIGMTAIIPIVGAFIGCVVGIFLILIENPVQAVIFLILFFVLQQIEGKLIYPKVVGNFVGLPGIWVLFAVTIGGSLFGILGMFAFVPLVSTGYSLLRDDVNRRNELRDA
jgi:predicted PurR-regulated permease PerM